MHCILQISLGTVAVFGSMSPTLFAQAPAAANPLQVSPQGLFQSQPQGQWSLQATPTGGDFTAVISDLLLTSKSGEFHQIPQVSGTGFLVSNSGQIIVTNATHSDAMPVHLRVLDRVGQELYRRQVEGLTDPQLSLDRDQLAMRTRIGVEVLDLTTFETQSYPRYDAFAVDADGWLAGTVLDSNQIQVHNEDGLAIQFSLPASPRRLAFAPSNGNLWVLTASALYEVDRLSGEVATRFVLKVEGELRDLQVAKNAIHLGARRVTANGFAGRHVVLSPSGRFQSMASGPNAITPPSHQIDAEQRGLIPWPLAPNSQHPIGNTYGEYQNYGGSPYLHPGIDVLGNNNQPVYAVAAGKVKAVLTTSGQYHWRVAIGGQGSGTTTGYLYAHMVQSSITVSVGDTVTKGQYLGNLVAWPTSGFTHCHFARLEDSGNQWYGDWLCPDNPHVDLENRSETTAPVFENAVNNQLFAFCRNQTSTYRDPNNLFNKVDIIVHIGDRLNSNWTCAVQTLRYSIYPVGNPNAPVVDNKLAVNFDMALDTYGSSTIDAFLVDLLYKEDSTCNTNGDYNSREFFHIITNSDGDQIYNAADEAESWNTSLVPNGDYVVEVVAKDAAGNRSVGRMTVTVNN